MLVTDDEPGALKVRSACPISAMTTNTITQTSTEITFVQPPLAEGPGQNPIYVEQGGEGSNPLFDGKRAGQIGLLELIVVNR